MANFFRKIFEGLRLVPKTTSTVSEAGDVDFDSTSNKFNAHNGTTSSPIVTEAHAATLTNKTIDGDLNTLQDVSISSLKTEAGDALKALARNASGAVVSSSFKLEGNAQIIEHTADATAGAVTALNTTDKGAIRLTAATSLAGLASGVDGKEVRVLNNTGSAITISNEAAGASASDRILTGTGANITIGNDGIIILRYSSADSRWHIAGGSGSSDPDMVEGPASATDNAIARFDGTTGKLIQNSSATLNDDGDIDTAGVVSALAANVDEHVGIAHSGLTDPATGVARIFATSEGRLIHVPGVTGGNPIPLTHTEIINYIENGDAELGVTTGWATYADAAGTAPVDGTGGTANVTISASSTTPLRGGYDFNLVKDAANRQGQGWSYDFTINRADQAKVLQISFDYEVVSGTYATSDVTVWIYDVDSAALIQPAPSSLENISGKGKWRGTFQTSSSSANYRLIYHVSSTSASAYTLAVDNIVVSPQIITQGTPVTDWVSYTPTITHNSGGATNFTAIGQWRRVGDTMEVRGSMLFSATSAAFSEVYASLPSGYSADANKVPVSGIDDAFPVGYGHALDNATTNYTLGPVTYSNTTRVRVRYDGAAGAALSYTASAPFTFNLNDSINWNFVMPIAGWSSQVQMSSETDTRVVALTAQKTSGQHTSTGNDQTVASWSTASFDTHAGFNTTTGVYTVPVSGIYEVAGNVVFAANATGHRYSYVTQSGSVSRTVYGDNSLGSTSLAYNAAMVVGQFNCVAGDTLLLGAFQSSGGNLNYNTGTPTTINIRRVSGPSQIAASETVTARYSTAAGQSIANGATAIVDYGTKSYDSHNAVTTGGSWKFTAPMSGKYRITAKQRYANGLAWTQSGSVYFQIFKNGSAYSLPGETVIATSFTSGTGFSVHASDEIDLLAGEYVDVRASHQETSARALLAVGSHNFICITRIGN